MATMPAGHPRAERHRCLRSAAATATAATTATATAIAAATVCSILASLRCTTAATAVNVARTDEGNVFGVLYFCFKFLSAHQLLLFRLYPQTNSRPAINDQSTEPRDVVSRVFLFNVENINPNLHFLLHSGIAEGLNGPQTPIARHRFVEEVKGKGTR